MNNYKKRTITCPHCKKAIVFKIEVPPDIPEYCLTCGRCAPLKRFCRMGIKQTIKKYCRYHEEKK